MSTSDFNMSTGFEMRVYLPAARLILLLLCAPLSSADVVLDGTTGGTAGTSVGAGNGFTYDIQSSLGNVKSSNLFHSFSEFDIAVTEHANFTGDAAINNIIARITGGESSSIAGRITSSIDSASLWLINPSGFLFANGAVVDIDGAFNLSTADFIEFANDARFYADLSNDSVLTSAAISSFGFIGSAGGSISFTSDRASSIGEDRSSGQNINVNSQFILMDESTIFSQEINVTSGNAELGDIDIYDSRLETVEGGIYFQGGNILSVDSTIFNRGRRQRHRNRFYLSRGSRRGWCKCHSIRFGRS